MYKTFQTRIQNRRLLNKEGRYQDKKDTWQSEQAQNFNKNDPQWFLKLREQKLESEINQLEKQYEESEIRMQLFDWQSKAQLQRTKNKFEIAIMRLGQSYHPRDVSCRDQEKADIQHFIDEGIGIKGCRQTLYISGVPGIGKTLCVNEVVDKMKKQEKKRTGEDLQVIFVNAMNLKKAKDIFKVIWEKLSGTSKGSLNALYYLNQFFHNGYVEHHSRISLSSTKVIIIDEIDYLYTKDEEVIYNILEWTQQKKSKIILLAISNTLDFQGNLSPKVASRMGNRRIIFKPYAGKQIEAILKERIQGLQVFQENALEFISRKISGCCSDIRKSLFILRQSISVYVRQCLKNRVSSNKVPLQILISVRQESFQGSLTKYFTYLPYMYKVVLINLAKYFRFQKVACTYTQLHIRSRPFMKGKICNLKPVLLQLRDNGLIQYQNLDIRSDKRINKGVKLYRHYQEQHITLIPSVDQVLYAASSDQNNLISIQD